MQTDPMKPLLDRQSSLEALTERLARPSSLSLVYGQRRVGKTFLLQHLLANRPGSVYFLAEETTSTALLRRFWAEVSSAGAAPGLASPNDWGTALTLLCQAAGMTGHPLQLVLDECQYLLEVEPGLPSILQRIWDEWQDRVSLHVILCGSSLGGFSRLGEVGQPLYGRFGLRLRLPSFTYREAALFAPSWERTDLFRLYGLFGGLARHLAEVREDRSLADNFVGSVLDPLSPLHEAVPDLLRTEHLSSRAEADAVLTAIAAGESGFNAILARAGLSSNRGDYVLKELLALGVIVRITRSGDRDGSRYARYRCADPFTVSWYDLVRPNRGALQGTPAPQIWEHRVAPRLDDLMGRIFEDVVGQACNGGVLAPEIGPVDRTAPYWSRDGRTEIDFVVESGDTVTCVECKWRARALTDLDALKQLRAHVSRHPSLARRPEVRLCLASSTGFTERLSTVAASEGVLLVGPERLLP